MATKEQIENAYKLVRDQELKLMKDIDALATDFNAKVKALVDAQPAGAEASAARQLLGRIQGATMGVFGYDLQNMKVSYGLVDTPAPTA